MGLPGGEAKVILQKLQVRDSSLLGYSVAVLHSPYVGLYHVALPRDQRKSPETVTETLDLTSRRQRVPEEHGTVCRAGHGSRLDYSGEEAATIYRGK